MPSNEDVKKVYSDAKALLSQYEDITKSLCNSNTPVHKQIFSGKVPLLWQGQHPGGCERHMDVFNDLNVIPEYCFGCYKVSVKPNTVVELFKLLILFDDLDLKNNNTSKCTIETREDVEGSYVGLIYCEDKEDGESIVNIVKQRVHNEISEHIQVFLKHGCSEFPLVFPEFADIVDEDHMMEYRDEWREKEKAYDKNHTIKVTPLSYPTCTEYSNYNYNKALALRAWLQYAATIDDKSYKEITDEIVFPLSNLIRPSSEKSGLIKAEAAETDVDIIFNQAYKDQQAGKAIRARQGYLDVLLKKPEHADANHLLGVLASEQGDYKFAITNIKKILDDNPESSNANFNLGNVYYANEDYDQALEYFEKSLASDPQYVKALVNIALTHKNLGQYDMALDYFQQALKLDANNLQACNSLGGMCLEMNRLNDAMTCFNRSLEIDAKNCNTHKFIGDLLYKSGDRERSIEYYRNAIQLNPLFTEAYYELGNIYREQNLFDEAIKNFNSVLQLQGNHFDSHYMLGLIYKKQNLNKDAIKQFKKSLMIKPDFKEAKDQLDSIESS